MKTQFILLCTLVALFSFSCSEEDKDPDTSKNPVLELEWLSEKADELGKGEFAIYNYIVSAKYQSEPVFVMANCCPMCNSVMPVYNDEGVYLGILGSGDGEWIDSGDLSEKEIIWKGEGFLCQDEVAW